MAKVVCHNVLFKSGQPERRIAECGSGFQAPRVVCHGLEGVGSELLARS